MGILDHPAYNYDLFIIWVGVLVMFSVVMDMVFGFKKLMIEKHTG